MAPPTTLFGLDLMKLAVPLLREVTEMKQMLDMKESLHGEIQQSMKNVSKRKLNELEDETSTQSFNHDITENNDRMKAGLDASAEPSTNVQSSERKLPTTESKHHVSESKPQEAKTNQQESQSKRYESETKWHEPYTKHIKTTTKQPPKKKAKPCDKKKSTPTAKKEPVVARAFYGLIKAYNAISRVSCVSLAPPQGFVGLVAFYPPSPWQFYYLSYYNEEKKSRCFGNAKQCYGKSDLRIEPVLWVKKLDEEDIEILTMYIKRTEPFVLLTKSKNYIVGGKIKADLNLVEITKHPKVAPSHKVLLIANNNACDLGITFNGVTGYLISYQHPEEYDVYFFDYSGFGLSTGQPTESAVYHDIEAMYEHIVSERNDPKLEIILMGVSIGTAVVADLASKNLPYVTGLILVAPLLSAVRHISGSNPPKKTSKSDCFRTIDKAPSIKVPVLCIHGLKDNMMPPKNSADICDAAPYGLEPLYVPNSDHLGVLTKRQTGIRISAFIEDDIEKWKLKKPSAE